MRNTILSFIPLKLYVHRKYKAWDVKKAGHFWQKFPFFPQSTRTTVKTTVFLSRPTAATLAETSNSLLC